MISTLYHYLQDHTIYVNVSIGNGGLQSYPASYVCQNKYGDCKALTTYMKALLNYANINADEVLIESGKDLPHIIPSVPGQQFNHVILCVPLEGDTIWLDNTSGSIPYNYIGTSNQNRYGLLINQQKSQLIRTPKLTSDDVITQRTYNYKLNDQGDGTVQMHANIKGSTFEQFAYINKRYKNEKQSDEVADFFDCEIEKFERFIIDQNHRDSCSITLSAKAQVLDQMKCIGKMKVIQPIPINFPRLRSPNDRKYPVQISIPTNKVDSMHYEIDTSKDYQYQIPKDISIRKKYGCFIIRSSISDHIIHIYRQFKIYQGAYSLDEYPDFYEFINQAKETQKKMVILITPKKTAND